MTVGEKREFLKKYRILVSKIKRLKEMLEGDTERKEKYIKEIGIARGIRDKIEDMIESGKIPNLIFYGPAGVGKTTVARIIANRSGMQLHKLNGTTEQPVVPSVFYRCRGC